MLSRLLVSCLHVSYATIPVQVKVSIRDVEEGTHLREFSLYSPRDSTATVAIIMVSRSLASLQKSSVKPRSSSCGPQSMSGESRRQIVMQASVTYEYLRGTKDEGSYLGPSRVLINKRRMRGFKVSCLKHSCA